ncbi:MAG: queuosine salvage family protein [Thermoprotei archaeon]
MEVIGIDTRMIERIARILSRHSNAVKPLDVFDEKYYPSKDMDRETTLRYFLVMVAMDHRLSRPGKPYEACLEDGCYHGADLLYRLGKKKLDENPEFFSPETLSKITIEDVVKWLRVGNAEPPDPEVRAYLLRDLGVKLLKLYNGSAESLIESSKNRVRGSGVSPGLTDLLRVFRAYEDPAEKKPLLLIKFLKARGLFNPVDHVDIPVDNHLSRIAYRLGIVMVSGRLWDKIKSGAGVTREEDILLRMHIRRAYRILAEKANIDLFLLDDYLWDMGRRICIRDTPYCDKCLFKNVCLARNNPKFVVNEHVFYNTWYY